jgi:hypothetical protein
MSQTPPSANFVREARWWGVDRAARMATAADPALFISLHSWKLGAFYTGCMAAHPYGPGWAALRRATFAAKGRLCWWCGAAASTVDHVIPVRLGGTNDESNLVPACPACNYGRGAALGNRIRGARRHGGQVVPNRSHENDLPASWRSSRDW